MSIYFRKSRIFYDIRGSGTADRPRFRRGTMAGKVISLRAADGHTLSAYEARPGQPPRAGLALLQEIFGVTAHIRRVCDGYAAQGYHVVAPALFDRIRPGTELGYSKEDAVVGRDLRSTIPWDHVLADVTAAKGRLSVSGKVATLGYCWGGTIAWRSAAQVNGVAAAVCYYATQIGPYVALSGAHAFRRERSDRDARACGAAARGTRCAGRDPGLPREPRLQLRRNPRFPRIERGAGSAPLARFSGDPHWLRGRMAKRFENRIDPAQSLRYATSRSFPGATGRASATRARP
jgi:dienelactone hydrolase